MISKLSFCANVPGKPSIDFGFPRRRASRAAAAPGDRRRVALARPHRGDVAAAGLCPPPGRRCSPEGTGDGAAIEGPSLVRLLDNLERRGLIRAARGRDRSPRARCIHLTPSGRDLAVRAAKVWRDPGPAAGQRAGGGVGGLPARVRRDRERGLDERSACRRRPPTIHRRKRRKR